MDWNLEKKLRKRYYHLGYNYSECDNGWFKLIDECLFLIDKELYPWYIPKIIKSFWYWLSYKGPYHYRFSFINKYFYCFTILQIKEKFGLFRNYTNYSTDKIESIIDQAATASSYTCELCGSLDGKVKNINHWLKCICDQCELTRNK